MMKLILLGTGGLIPTDEAQTACFMLPEVGVFLDAGTGIYRMKKHLQTADIDIYLTHADGDHTRGLGFLFGLFLSQEISRLQTPIEPASVDEAVKKAHSLLRTVRIHASQTALDYLVKEYEPFHLNWHLLEEMEPLPFGGILTSFSVTENDEVGFRLNWPGHTLAYVTDATATPCAKYIESIRGVDVLLHDGYGLNNLEEMMMRISHSTLSGAARLAAKAGVGRLILVHHHPIETWSVSSDFEAAKSIFPNTVLGVDGMEFEF